MLLPCLSWCLLFVLMERPSLPLICLFPILTVRFLLVAKQLCVCVSVLHVACGILVPQPGIKPESCPAVEAQSLNRWTTREIPKQIIFQSFSPQIAHKCFEYIYIYIYMYVCIYIYLSIFKEAVCLVSRGLRHFLVSRF